MVNDEEIANEGNATTLQAGQIYELTALTTEDVPKNVSENATWTVKNHSTNGTSIDGRSVTLGVFEEDVLVEAEYNDPNTGVYWKGSFTVTPIATSMTESTDYKFEGLANVTYVPGDSLDLKIVNSADGSEVANVDFQWELKGIDDSIYDYQEPLDEDTTLIVNAENAALATLSTAETRMQGDCNIEVYAFVGNEYVVLPIDMERIQLTYSLSAEDEAKVTMKEEDYEFYYEVIADQTLPVTLNFTCSEPVKKWNEEYEVFAWFDENPYSLSLSDDGRTITVTIEETNRVTIFITPENENRIETMNLMVDATVNFPEVPEQ